jgi:hypothetical protein
VIVENEQEKIKRMAVLEELKRKEAELILQEMR